LAGEGADEIFAGYSFHKVIKLTEKYYTRVPEMITHKLLIPLVSKLPVKFLDKLFIYPAYLGNKGKERVVEYLRNYSHRSLNENYIYLKSLFDNKERDAVFGKIIDSKYRNEFCFTKLKKTNSYKNKNQFFDNLLKLQFDNWLQDNLLLRQDKNTMAHSLELRVPFLDHNLVELAFQMPAHLKVNGLVDKYVERDVARKILPKNNAKRRKIPFYIPLEYFYKNPELRDFIYLTLNRRQVEKRGYFDYRKVRTLIEKMESGEFLYLKQVMALVILELWHLIFIDKQKMW
jgi:asparagine synthase (glutamine-hydrolysing)